jgi:hypothetical protein
LVERLLPIGDESGDGIYLHAVQQLVASETGAERQRRIYRQTGSWVPVIDDMKDRWVHELTEIAMSHGAPPSPKTENSQLPSSQETESAKAKDSRETLPRSAAGPNGKPHTRNDNPRHRSAADGRS